MSAKYDLRAAIEARVPLGVVAGELNCGQVMFALPKYLRSGGAVFVDSGAFSAFRTGEAPDFNSVLSTYEMIAEMTEDHAHVPDQLYLVSPDVVGDQMATLRLLCIYKERLQDLMAFGCKMIVPLQRGEIPAAEMLERVKDILGTDRFVAGIPSCVSALSINECATLDHHAFHILGRVQQNAEQALRIAALAARRPDAAITADANWLRSRLEKICKRSDQVRESRIGTEVNIATPAARTAAILDLIIADTTWADNGPEDLLSHRPDKICFAQQNEGG